MRPPSSFGRGGQGRQGSSGGRGSGFGGRGGSGRGGFRDEGPPAEITEVGAVMHECEAEIVCKLIEKESKVPHFNAGIYLENKKKIGKVDEIFGPINGVMFTVKPDAGVFAKSFQKNDVLYIGTEKLLPLTRFTNPGKPSSGGGGRGFSGGGRGPPRGGGRGPPRGGGRGGGGRSPASGRGFSSSTGRGPSGRGQSPGRGFNSFGRGGGGRFSGRGRQ